MNAEIGIIGGTGLYDLSQTSGFSEYTVGTLYGDASMAIGQLDGITIAFMTRHGKGHTIPPHLVNYRANISALAMAGVKRILASASVGSLNPDMKPGHLVLLDQFIDFTRARPLTFFEGGAAGVVHTDMTEPYCPQLRGILARCSSGLGASVHTSGVYVCTEGPRFETPAEIKMFRTLGGDVVGMTNVPEVVLAKEKGICYAAVAVVTNFAAGISPKPLSHQEVLEAMDSSSRYLRELLQRAVKQIPADLECGCSGQEQVKE